LTGQILVLSSDGLHLSTEKKQLIIRSKSGSATSRPLEDIALILLESRQCVVTVPLLNAALEQGVGLVICDERRHPSGLLAPFQGMSLAASRIVQQSEMKVPLKKRLWKSIIETKLMLQADNLAHVPRTQRILQELAKRVSSGDRTNCEATGARAYWEVVFAGLAEGFQRSGSHPINSLLNYCYALVRAAMARAIVSTGLHPALGVFHSGRTNSFALADDLMEPYRALVDLWVKGEVSKQFQGSPPEAENSRFREGLLPILTSRVRVKKESVTFLDAVSQTATSFFASIEAKNSHLVYPSKCEFLATD
jgi:CRISPR-associated protein Cas1